MPSSLIPLPDDPIVAIATAPGRGRSASPGWNCFSRHGAGLKTTRSIPPVASDAATLSIGFPLRMRCVQTVGSGRMALSWIACRLDTGRTHQIRVHLESIGHPLVGDPVYRRGRPAPGPTQGGAAPAWLHFPRQALHACRLGLVHPLQRTAMSWFRAPPADMRELMRQCGFAGGDVPVEVFG